MILSIVRDLLVLLAFGLALSAYVRVAKIECNQIAQEERLNCIIFGKQRKELFFDVTQQGEQNV